MSTDIFDRRLNGVAIYNPDLLSKEELVEQFIARQDLLDHLVADLRRPGFKQHQVIVGTRGMGKTTLLRRLRYAVEDDPRLDAVWIPVTFPEEQYNVAHLSDLYLNFIDALGDALEHRRRREEADALDEAREALPRGDEPRRAQAALELLLETATRLDRRLLLLVDNLDLVLERLAKQPGEQWAFREVLSQKHAILLIGAMPVVIGATYDYDAPFYDFFRIHELGGLTRDETRCVLMRMSQQQRAEAVQILLDTDPARIDTLHALTGGNPRTVALLFGVLAQGTNGDVRTDLERLLDQSTPLYKARFEALPAQAQQLVDAIAIHWDPISAGELAEKMSLDVNTVSAQINRLVQQGVLEKVEYDPSTKTGFQVAERFFNIWYLMRASRRVRRRLIWLVRFLRVFFGATQLKIKIDHVLRSAGVGSAAAKLRHAEMCLALAEVVDEDKKVRSALETTAIRSLMSDAELNAQIAGLLDLDGVDASLRPILNRERWVQQFSQAVDSLSIKEAEKRDVRSLIGGAPSLTCVERLSVVQQWGRLLPKARRTLLRSFQTSHQVTAHIYGSRVASRLIQAIREGYMDSEQDEEGAASAAIFLDAPELEARFAANHADSVERLRRLSQESDDPFVWILLARVLSLQNETEEALAVVKGVPGGAGFAYADVVHGEILLKLGRLEEAIGALSQAVKRWPDYSGAWRKLGNAFFEAGRTAESVDAYQKALTIRRDPTTLADFGRDLLLMKHAEEAVTLLREAHSSDKEQVTTALYLALCLIQLGQSSEARELASTIRQRVDLDDTDLLSTAFVLLAVDEGPLAMDLVQPIMPRALQFEGPKLVVLLQFLGEAARRGYGSVIAEQIEEAELQETSHPLYVALQISGEARRERLKRLSPEARVATEALLQQWGIAEASASRKTAKSRVARKK